MRDPMIGLKIPELFLRAFLSFAQFTANMPAGDFCQRLAASSHQHAPSRIAPSFIAKVWHRKRANLSRILCSGAPYLENFPVGL